MAFHASYSDWPALITEEIGQLLKRMRHWESESLSQGLGPAMHKKLLRDLFHWNLAELHGGSYPMRRWSASSILPFYPGAATYNQS